MSWFHYCYGFIHVINTSHFFWLVWLTANRKTHTCFSYILNHRFLSASSSLLLLIILKFSINVLDWYKKIFKASNTVLSIPPVLILPESSKSFCSELFPLRKYFLVLWCGVSVSIWFSHQSCCLHNISNFTFFFPSKTINGNSHSYFWQPTECTMPAGPQAGLEHYSQQKHPSGFTYSTQKIPLTPARVTNRLKCVASNSST